METLNFATGGVTRLVNKPSSLTESIMSITSLPGGGGGGYAIMRKVRFLLNSKGDSPMSVTLNLTVAKTPLPLTPGYWPQVVEPNCIMPCEALTVFVAKYVPSG